jgi:queuine tRNA-ribosyltransferase
MTFCFLPGARDAATRARRGILHTAHGTLETPAFMPVGTRATVTGLTPEDLHALGAGMILGNTYHLLLRPGPEAIRHFGGLHRFMGWDQPILTDSGGFQIFSLASDRTVTEAGARFKSYVDCRSHHLSPERSIEVQAALGSDVMMALDVCLPSTAEPAEIREAMERTHRWALRSLAARQDPAQALFAIVQGGLSPEFRAESARFLTQHPFDGFAIGGLAVGDSRAERADVVALSTERLPEDRPRYLMGVGTPPDILEAVAQGVDLFDCVIPTRMAWQGTSFTSTGMMRITRGEDRLSEDPLDRERARGTCARHPPRIPAPSHEVPGAARAAAPVGAQPPPLPGSHGPRPRRHRRGAVRRFRPRGPGGRGPPRARRQRAVGTTTCRSGSDIVRSANRTSGLHDHDRAPGAWVVRW